MSRRILYLDQSLSNTGWALWQAGEDLVSGSWPLAKGTRLRGEAFRSLFGHLDRMHKIHQLTEICHEQPVFGAANQGEDQLIASVGLIGIIELFACSRSIEVRSVRVQSWRTTWFLKHERKAINAMPAKRKDWKRRALMRAEQYGFDPLSHDEAEAIAICDHDLLSQRITPEWRAADLQLSPVY